jgi:FtsP/CotA-like multicopper oxidase with cupredoxin domain
MPGLFMRRRAFIRLTALMFAVPAAAQPAPKVFEVAIANGRVDASRGTIRVTKGDNVELRWSSDRPISLHLHGYDLEAQVSPQSPAVMSFNANLTGRFPVSEHRHGGGRERVVLYLEVHP